MAWWQESGYSPVRGWKLYTGMTWHDCQKNKDRRKTAPQVHYTDCIAEIWYPLIWAYKLLWMYLEDSGFSCRRQPTFIFDIIPAVSQPEAAFAFYWIERLLSWTVPYQAIWYPSEPTYQWISDLQPTGSQIATQKNQLSVTEYVFLFKRFNFLLCTYETSWDMIFVTDRRKAAHMSPPYNMYRWAQKLSYPNGLHVPQFWRNPFLETGTQADRKSSICYKWPNGETPSIHAIWSEIAAA